MEISRLKQRTCGEKRMYDKPPRTPQWGTVLAGKSFKGGH